MGRISKSLLSTLALTPGLAFAQIQFQYDYSRLPHAPQSDSARSYSYDENGNRIFQGLQYTPSNMIFKAGGMEYRYGPSGERIAKIQRDASGNITKIERYFGAIETDGTTRSKYYSFASSRIAKKSSAGVFSFFHSDHLNSSTVTADASGNVQTRMEYYEFGSVKSQEGTQVQKYNYTGQEWDRETNLYNYNARMYDSVIGKFTSADSIIPDLTNPQSLNRYAYVRNNPLGRVDPSGHVDNEPLPKAAAYFFGALQQMNRALSPGSTLEIWNIDEASKQGLENLEDIPAVRLLGGDNCIQFRIPIHFNGPGAQNVTSSLPMASTIWSWNTRAAVGMDVEVNFEATQNANTYFKFYVDTGIGNSTADFFGGRGKIYLGGDDMEGFFLKPSWVSASWNWLPRSLAHEFGHTAFDLYDTYKSEVMIEGHYVSYWGHDDVFNRKRAGGANHGTVDSEMAKLWNDRHSERSGFSIQEGQSWYLGQGYEGKIGLMNNDQLPNLGETSRGFTNYMRKYSGFDLNQ